jgi:hypothetical protein
VVEIFINYRTADEPYGAALIDNHLSAAFGDDVVFRAAKSIPPGEDFADRMLRAVRGATVLLAVIGPKWLGELKKRDAEWRRGPAGDWVRREIGEAFEHGVRVVPVLMGVPRLVPADLPADLARLAECQDVRIHFRDTATALPAFAARLCELIPDLSAKPPEVVKRSPVYAQNVGSVFNGNVDIRGSFTSFVNDYRRNSGSER